MNDNEMSETDLPQAQQPAKKKRVISLAKLAVILDGVAIVAVGLTYLCSMGATVSTFFIIPTLLSFMLIFLSAIAGLVIGITALCLRPKSKSDVGCAITAIALPILAVLILILCLSTGVVVIRFM